LSSFSFGCAEVGPLVGKPAPDFTLRDDNAQANTLSDYNGAVQP